jgi:hypothetical protein
MHEDSKKKKIFQFLTAYASTHTTALLCTDGFLHAQISVSYHIRQRFHIPTLSAPAVVCRRYISAIMMDNATQPEPIVTDRTATQDPWTE